jgi:hypothetical protein
MSLTRQDCTLAYFNLLRAKIFKLNCSGTFSEDIYDLARAISNSFFPKLLSDTHVKVVIGGKVGGAASH